MHLLNSLTQHSQERCSLQGQWARLVQTRSCCSTKIDRYNVIRRVYIEGGLIVGGKQKIALQPVLIGNLQFRCTMGGACALQSVDARVGDIDSNEEKTEQPNSDAKVPR